MNKKSSIGLVLLVTMVLAKAFIPFNVDDENPIQRKTDLTAALQVNSEIRSDQEVLQSEPTVHLIAANIPTDYSDFSATRSTYSNTPNVITSSNNSENLLAINEVNVMLSDANEQIDEEALPLEGYSNTGYGLWKKPQEKIKSFNDRPSEIPLDNGNTISDNISKLFPRTN